MDGFLRGGTNDIYTIGYYTATDIPLYAALAKNYASSAESVGDLAGFSGSID
jgi:hypothetical protein